MINKEFEAVSGISPELFVPGREVMRYFSPDNKPDKEPSYDEMIERGRRRLLEAIVNGDESDGNVVFSAETPPALKNKKQNYNPWEPFNLEPNPSQRFVNLYGGPYSQQMELNRANAERLLEVAAIQGRVTLTDVPMDRNRSIAGVNTDGSVTKRRGLFWGEKIEEDESKAMVKPIPEGWKIEIPGQEIIEELSRQESKKPIGERFTTRINQTLRNLIGEVIFREKLTSDKSSLLSRIYFSSPPWWGFLFLGIPLRDFSTYSIITPLVVSAFYYPAINSIRNPRNRENLAKYEYFLPPLEIDRVLRGFTFANLKGRNLVRLRPDENKTPVG